MPELMIETQIMPASVYVGDDKTLPRWRFLVILGNKSQSECTLKNCQVRVETVSLDEVALEYEVPIERKVFVQGSAHIMPDAYCVLDIHDQDLSIGPASRVNMELLFVNSEAKEIKKTISVQLVPTQTLYMDFPLDGMWKVINGRDKFHGCGLNFAFDLILEEDWLIHWNASGKSMQPYEFKTFGQPLYSPIDGIVEAVESNMPDLESTPGGPATYQKGVPSGQSATVKLGNYVLIRGEDKSCVLMVHFKQGSLRVGKGQAVSVGQMIGEVGNSGNTTGAHLHIEVLDDVPEFAFLGSDKFCQSGQPFGFRNVLRKADGFSCASNVVPATFEIMKRAGCR